MVVWSAVIALAVVFGAIVAFSPICGFGITVFVLVVFAVIILRARAKNRQNR